MQPNKSPSSSNILRGDRIWKSISIHESFISFTKTEIKICVLLKTFSEMTYVMGRTVPCVLIRTFLEVTSLLEITVFLFGLTYFVRNIGIKITGTNDTVNRSVDTKDAYITGAYISGTYSIDICTRVSICSRSTYIGAADIESGCIRVIGATSARCTGGVDVLKNLKISLQ